MDKGENLTASEDAKATNFAKRFAELRSEFEWLSDQIEELSSGAQSFEEMLDNLADELGSAEPQSK